MFNVPARPRSFGVVACCGFALCLSSSLLADPPRTADPLKGPEVRDRQVPGVEGSFGEPGGERKKFVNENRLPPRVFRDAMEPLLAPDAPDNLRVTDEQRERYRGWMDDFQKSVGAYMKDHQSELQELRKKAGEKGRRPGGPDGQGQPPQAQPDEMKPEADAKETGAARERLQTIMAGAPKIEDLYTKIWTELKPDQQKAVDARIQEFRAQQAKEREDRYVQQKSKKKNPGAPEGQPGQPPKPGDKAAPRPEAADRAPESGAQGQPGPVDPQRRERLMRIFSRMTPEQQEQLLQRLERFRAENGDNPPQLPGRRRSGPEGPGERKPAPQPDDSMMPPLPKPSEPENKP